VTLAPVPLLVILVFALVENVLPKPMVLLVLKMRNVPLPLIALELVLPARLRLLPVPAMVTNVVDSLHAMELCVFHSSLDPLALPAEEIKTA
jgi:hypothetical protein